MPVGMQVGLTLLKLGMADSLDQMEQMQYRYTFLVESGKDLRSEAGGGDPVVLKEGMTLNLVKYDSEEESDSDLESSESSLKA